jgi:CHASE2 domain-containing sensor protein
VKTPAASEAVSQRMLKRMIFFSGIPVGLGILVFFASYVLITQGIAELPNVAVLLTTLACFGLSVIGLSYGALSASWEEDAVGSLLGMEQFQVNFERLTGSWRQAREEKRKKAEES